MIDFISNFNNYLYPKIISYLVSHLNFLQHAKRAKIIIINKQIAIIIGLFLPKISLINLNKINKVGKTMEKYDR